MKKYILRQKNLQNALTLFFSNNVDKIAHYFGVEPDRDNISVDMLMEWLVEDGTNYADFIGFIDSFYEKSKN